MQLLYSSFTFTKERLNSPGWSSSQTGSRPGMSVEMIGRTPRAIFQSVNSNCYKELLYRNTDYYYIYLDLQKRAY